MLRKDSVEGIDDVKPRKRIDHFIDDALCEFDHWLRGEANEWRAKEWDTVAVFVDVFLRKHVGAGAAVHHQSQIRIESQVGTTTNLGWRGVRKDVVIWPEPYMSCWDEQWKATRVPRAVLEFKQWRSRPKSMLFDQNDSEWVAAWTIENPKSLGYVVTIDLSDRRCVHWQVARGGRFGKPKRGEC